MYDSSSESKSDFSGPIFSTSVYSDYSVNLMKSRETGLKPNAMLETLNGVEHRES